MNIIFIKREKAGETKAWNNLVKFISKANSTIRIYAQELRFSTRLGNEMSALSTARTLAPQTGDVRRRNSSISKDETELW